MDTDTNTDDPMDGLPQCSCDGCWACDGHMSGCTCDVDWDALAEERRIE